jgi:hypothetical protein
MLDPPEVVDIETVASVTLSPTTAKSLLALLQTHVNAYERTFGEINLDPTELVTSSKSLQ